MPLIFLNILLIVFAFSLDQGEPKSFGTKDKDGVPGVRLGEGFAGTLEEQWVVAVIKPKRKETDRNTRPGTGFLHIGHRPSEREFVQGDISPWSGML